MLFTYKVDLTLQPTCGKNESLESEEMPILFAKMDRHDS